MLVHILYGQYSHMEVGQSGIITLTSVRKLARLLGTQSATINQYFSWLEDHGYLSDLSYGPRKRSVQFRVRPPSNIIYQR